MVKRKYMGLLILTYLAYFAAIITKNNIIGDILSPILTLIAFCFVFYGFVVKEKNKIFIIAGLSYSMCIFSWFIMDTIWGISTLVLHVNPEDNIVISYGYSATNYLLLIVILIWGYLEIKNWNKMQAFFDVMMVSLCITVMLWVFIFEQDMEKAAILRSDGIFMTSLLADVIIFAWISIWFFSIRNKKAPFFISFSASGVIIFVLTDILYYYQYFYLVYEPNSLLDGGYVLSFTCMAIGAFVKAKTNPGIVKNIPDRKGIGKFGKKLFFLTVPVVLVMFKGTQTRLLLYVITSMLLYFIFTNYIQNNIYRDEILEKEKEHVRDLEKKVKERTREIEKVMNTDVITGLFNRRYFEIYLENLCDNLKQNEHAVLLYIDQNKYKYIKALYGKYIAEILLKEIGKRIDTVVSEEEGVLASYGEDVFVAVLSGLFDYEQGVELANKIISRCSDVYYIENHDIRVTLNIGISCYPADSKNHEELIRNADMAMLHARTTGFNKISEYNEQIGNHAYYKNKIEMKLKKVVFDEEFSLLFQPQVLCKDGSLYGFEALIRWHTKNGESISPVDFIPVTEETGIIVPLGYWIMEKAAKQLATWKKQISKDFRMAVNVSTKQLLEPKFTSKLIEILNKYEISPNTFEIEITENVQIENNLEVLKTLNAIRDMGISIAIDDFGTGYSSFYYLKHLPINRIKIAKELVDNIENDIYSHSIVQMVISVAKANRIKVIAEGVETREQWECLKKLDCDEIQGFFFAKPMRPDELSENWIGNIM